MGAVEDIAVGQAENALQIQRCEALSRIDHQVGDDFAVLIPC
jgi:hypothetical protein